MITETTDALSMITVGCFVFGWLLAKLGSYFAARRRGGKRDPRDVRIRSLEADLRVAQTNYDKARAQIEQKDKDLAQARDTTKSSAASFRDLNDTITDLRRDLKDSVKKTRELRAELTERATEHVRSEVKLREVETELSVAQASTDLLATGMLDYTTGPDDDEELPAFRAGA